ncbi:hypothetical protein FH063_003051 [Azospirillum argentinense]|uniref:MFS transporter n=1 Tax=Azospirillum argentinense TaxID=2970906 RepID=A0A5B0KKG4_9PROT|nr:hypothetical protein FH063_003051 [Azospirillum argentinense]
MTATASAGAVVAVPAPGPLRHSLIAGLGVAQIVSWGTLVYSFPLLAEPTIQAFGLAKADVYLLASMALVVAALAAYPVGVLIDRGHGRGVMGLGSLLAGVGLLAWSQAQNAWQLYSVFLLLGLVQAMTLYDAAFAVHTGIFSALSYHLYPLLMERGFEAAAVVGAIAVIGPAQVAGRIAVSALAGRLPIRRLGSVIVAGLPLAAVLLFISGSNLLMVYLFAALYGAANGIMNHRPRDGRAGDADARGLWRDQWGHGGTGDGIEGGRAGPGRPGVAGVRLVRRLGHLRPRGRGGCRRLLLGGGTHRPVWVTGVGSQTWKRKINHTGGTVVAPSHAMRSPPHVARRLHPAPMGGERRLVGGKQLLLRGADCARVPVVLRAGPDRDPHRTLPARGVGAVQRHRGKPAGDAATDCGRKAGHVRAFSLPGPVEHTADIGT